MNSGNSLSDDYLMFWPSFGTCHDTVNHKMNLILGQTKNASFKIYKATKPPRHP